MNWASLDAMKLPRGRKGRGTGSDGGVGAQGRRGVKSASSAYTYSYPATRPNDNREVRSLTDSLHLHRLPRPSLRVSFSLSLFLSLSLALCLSHCFPPVQCYSSGGNYEVVLSRSAHIPQCPLPLAASEAGDLGAVALMKRRTFGGCF